MISCIGKQSLESRTNTIYLDGYLLKQDVFAIREWIAELLTIKKEMPRVRQMIH
jgi:hypothetical protein